MSRTRSQLELAPTLHQRACFCAIVLVVVSALAGCRVTAEQAVRRAATIASWGPGDVIDVRPRKSSFARSAKSWLTKAPKPSPRTEQLLRKFDVLDKYESNPDSVLAWLQKLASQSPVMEEIHALAELSQQQAAYAFERGHRGRAIRLYSIALEHSYQFLFSPQLDVERNAYDPQFRSMCDIYNQSLESMLRVVCDDGTLVPGKAMVVRDEELDVEFEVRIKGRWEEEQFEEFKLVGDYRTRGFDNEYRTYGLGVPLIAVRKQQEVDAPVEKYYPPDLTLAMTAFCHFENESQEPISLVGDTSGTRRGRAVLTLYDPLENRTIQAHSKTVPLQSDTTTPLAYHLNDPLLKTGVLATVSLLNAETTDQIHGMYMLEPYDPNKIPVVMVHGLWSSPVTWAHMFNDLRANADIHQNYQFWFYSYSTAQPFWISAMRMREDLRRIQKELDPEQQSQSLRQMVLVGHSMGGLISKMQTVASGDAFWNRVSRASLDSLTGDAATIEQVRRTFFFDPVPAVQRVVSIASPFGGSEFANNATRWFSHKLFTLPSFQTTDFERLIAGNPVAFSDPDLLTARTSIDSLSIGSPMIEALAEAEIADGVKFHNVIGVLPKKSVLGKEESGDSDGVVSVESARCVHAVSEVNVQAEHSHVHQDAACIYEVQRILLANLTQLQRIEGRQIPEIPFASRAYESPMHPLRLVPEHANRDDNQWVPPARVADRHAFDAANPMSSRRR